MFDTPNEPARHRSFAAVAIAAGVALCAIAFPAHAQKRRAQIEARVHETGSFTERVPYHVANPAETLEELARDSFIIVVGIAIANRSELTEDGRGIVMLHSVAVQEILKGRVGNRREITVVVPGGRVEFSDGNYAERRMSDFIPPLPGKRYVWFLERVRPGFVKSREAGPYELFEPSSGPLGIYQLDSRQGYVVTSGHGGELLAQRVGSQRLAAENFLAALRSLVTR